jgi:hypothetical protein
MTFAGQYKMLFAWGRASGAKTDKSSTKNQGKKLS